MTIVIDASVALKWVFDEPGSQAASDLRDDDLIAPVLWLAEVANGIWRRVRIGDITADEASSHLSELVSAPVASMPMELLVEDALALANETGHPVYDFFYLALALRRQTHVVTADRRFVAAVAGRADLVGRVRLLGT